MLRHIQRSDPVQAQERSNVGAREQGLCVQVGGVSTVSSKRVPRVCSDRPVDLRRLPVYQAKSWGVAWTAPPQLGGGGKGCGGG